MGSEYPSYKFESMFAAPLRNGIYKTKEFHGRGARIVNMGELFGYSRLGDVSMKRVELHEKEVPKVLLNEGDLLFARRSLTAEGAGKCSIVKKVIEPTTFESSIIRVRPDSEQVSSDYLYYFFGSPQGKNLLRTITRQVAVAGITGADLKQLELPKPDLANQKAIAHILGSLDDKIELNRQINQTLEDMAQALFKSWFVDFDPVIDNALKAGNPIPEPLQAKAAARQALQQTGQSKPLPADVQALFPAAFTFTDEMGWVPEGWVISTISEALTVNPRVSLAKGTVATFADMKAIPTSGYSVSEVVSKAYNGGSKFEQGDVLLARITPCLENGKTAIVDFLDNGEVGFGSTEFIVLRGKNSITKAFVACMSRNEGFRQHCMRSMVGSSGRQRVQNACFDDFYLSLPKQASVLSCFDDSVSPMFERLTRNGAVSNSLTKLRDTLLPKLISGELRIPDAEKLVAEAGI